MRLWWVGKPPAEALVSALAGLDTQVVSAAEPPWERALIDACLVDGAAPGILEDLVTGTIVPPIISILPAQASADDVFEALDSGAFDVLARPFTAAELVSRSLAARRHRLQRGRTRAAELTLVDRERHNEELSRELRWVKAERVRAEEDARQAESLATVGTFAAGIAHQINNPLTGVVGFGELLLIRDDLDESAVRDLGRMVDEAKRAARIIRDMLDLSKTCVRKEAVDINALVERTISVPQVARTLAPIDVECDLAPSLPFVGGDAFRLQQVFQNLLENSAHALEDVESAKIVVRTSVVGNTIHVRFADNGCGVPKDNEKKLFEAFFTTKGTRRKRRGTGLGLAVCRSIAREHLGDVFYETSKLGGACFVVRLPRIDSESSTEMLLRRAV